MAERKAKLLASCYRESLAIAAAQKLSSIAFSCISTGIFGYPPEQAVEVAIAAVRDFLRSPCSLREVIFCCYLESDLAIYQSYLGNTEDG
jgi:O-acetyl-ADP-ribose deacetylase (regulator of RNase III)